MGQDTSAIAVAAPEELEKQKVIVNNGFLTYEALLANIERVEIKRMGICRRRGKKRFEDRGFISDYEQKTYYYTRSYTSTDINPPDGIFRTQLYPMDQELPSYFTALGTLKEYDENRRLDIDILTLSKITSKDFVLEYLDSFSDASLSSLTYGHCVLNMNMQFLNLSASEILDPEDNNFTDLPVDDEQNIKQFRKEFQEMKEKLMTYAKEKL